MKLRTIALASAAACAAALFSGCATTTTADGKQWTSVLGGLYESREGAFSKQAVDTLPVNGEKPGPGARLSGDKVSFLWGFVSYRDQ